mgnify:CR=1 FL=1
MAKLTKKQKEALSKVEKGRLYNLQEGSALVKEVNIAKFDASVDIAVRLGVDPRKANQMVRGVVSLPHGTGKDVKVLALVTPDKEAEAKEAGADFVKTSTGFSSGGAVVEDVRLMRETVGAEMGVKASGGVRSRADAEAMVAAGATRLGTSSGVKIVAGQKEDVI